MMEITLNWSESLDKLQLIFSQYSHIMLFMLSHAYPWFNRIRQSSKEHLDEFEQCQSMSVSENPKISLA